MKDMQPSSEVIYQPDTDHTLARFIDVSSPPLYVLPQPERSLTAPALLCMAQGVECFFKAAIVDKNPSITSVALVSARQKGGLPVYLRSSTPDLARPPPLPPLFLRPATLHKLGVPDDPVEELYHAVPRLG